MHPQAKSAGRFPLHDLFDVTRPVRVRDPDSGAADAGRLDLEFGCLDFWDRAVALKLRPPGQIENLLGNAFWRNVERLSALKADRLHLSSASFSGQSLLNVLLMTIVLPCWILGPFLPSSLIRPPMEVPEKYRR